MAGFLLHAGATVLCAHAGQAQPTAPNPRVKVSGQPVVTQAAPYAVAGCPFNVVRRAGPLRDGAVGDRGAARAGRRAARPVAGQPGDLCTQRHATQHRDDPGAGQGAVGDGKRTQRDHAS